MSELTPEQRTDLRAAMALWEFLAVEAWGATLRRGPGVLLIHRADLRQAATDDSGALPVSHVPAATIPEGDDFGAVIRACDPAAQIPLIVRDEEGDEQLYVLEAEGDKRPSPEACYRRAQKNPSRH